MEPMVADSAGEGEVRKLGRRREKGGEEEEEEKEEGVPTACILSSQSAEATFLFNKIYGRLSDGLPNEQGPDRVIH
jgi:hypothetical protein